MNVMLLAAGLAAAAAAASAAGFLLVSRFVPERWLVADADAASALYATIGMVYAILIAIAAIAVWEPRAAAGQYTDVEAGSLIEVHWAANGLAETDRAELQTRLRAYLEEAAGPEWRGLHDRREPSGRATDLFTDLRLRADAVRPATPREEAALAQVTAGLSTAAEARRTRMLAAGEGMPGLLWPVLLGGGLMSVAFLYLFGLDRTFPNGLMMAAVGGMIALLLFVIYQVEYPFSRAFAIEPDSLLDALTRVGAH
ncbi:MAG: DUF4239 domain-containing protein [Hamadaea sp.]|nr:DUF4239 domain-containing protein [Hamadaea sp.]